MAASRWLDNPPVALPGNRAGADALAEELQSAMRTACTKLGAIVALARGPGHHAGGARRDSATLLLGQRRGFRRSVRAVPVSGWRRSGRRSSALPRLKARPPTSLKLPRRTFQAPLDPDQSDPREVMSDPGAPYWGGRVGERSLMPLGEARLGRIDFDEWLRHSWAAA
jgi:hypothetical protein